MSSSYVSVINEKIDGMSEEFMKKLEDRLDVQSKEDNERKHRISEKEQIERIEKKMAKEFRSKLETCFVDKGKDHTKEEKRKSRENEETTESSGQNGKTEFELMFKCISERFDLLHIITVDVKNPTEPEIDVAILRALLKCERRKYESRKSNVFLIFSVEKRFK